MKKSKVSVNKSVSKPVENDAVITKFIYGLAIFCISFILLNNLLPKYALNDYVDTMFTAFHITSIVCSVATIGFLVAWFVLRKSKPAFSDPAMALAVLMAVWAFTAGVLYTTWLTYTTVIYIVYGAALALYFIFLIYPREFFLVSGSNIAAALTFYCISKSKYILLLTIALIILLVVVNGLIYVGSKHKGKVGKYKLFHGSFVAMIPYGNAALLVLCLIGSLTLGSLFAYYCIFAVGAVELALAVYYTVKLA